MIEEILFVLEIIGTIAFAISGAFVAIKAGLDIFGVLFIGCVTAVGGGIFRDILIGQTPPAIFFNLHVLLVAVLTSLAVFIFAYLTRKKFEPFRVACVTTVRWKWKSTAFFKWFFQGKCLYGFDLSVSKNSNE